MSSQPPQAAWYKSPLQIQGLDTEEQKDLFKKSINTFGEEKIWIKPAKPKALAAEVNHDSKEMDNMVFQSYINRLLLI